ncbi:hypothetical protein BKA63DRAFT_489730 [Paraphoma chrysanthemicola]|nr:hypothetical protein BKA63DRAFT_489730 [Paraphoma chrysanthemicola]
MANSGQSTFSGDNNISTGITTPDKNGPLGRSTVRVAWDAISPLGRRARVDSHVSHEGAQPYRELGSLHDVVSHAQQEENYYSGSQESLDGNAPSKIGDTTCDVHNDSRQLKRERSRSPLRIQNQVASPASLGLNRQTPIVVGSPPSYGIHDYQDDTSIQAHCAPPSPPPESNQDPQPEPDPTPMQSFENFTFNQPPTITIPSSLYMTPIVRRPRHSRPRVRVQANAPPNLGPGPHLSGLFRSRTRLSITTAAAVQHSPPAYNASPPVSPRSSPLLRPATISPYPSCPPTPRLAPIEAWLAGLESPASTTASGRHILSGAATDEDGGSEQGDGEVEMDGERMVFCMSPAPMGNSRASDAITAARADSSSPSDVQQQQRVNRERRWGGSMSLRLGMIMQSGQKALV